MKNIIIGAHSIIYSTNPEADRAFLRDVLELSHVDVGDGWLIFGLPPAEIAIHPSDTNNVHELYLMCGDIEALIEKLKPLNIDYEPVQEPRWGLLTYVTLPGGGKLGVYQPRHSRPLAMSATKSATRSTKRAVEKARKANVRKPNARRTSKR